MKNFFVFALLVLFIFSPTIGKAQIQQEFYKGTVIDVAQTFTEETGHQYIYKVLITDTARKEKYVEINEISDNSAQVRYEKNDKVYVQKIDTSGGAVYVILQHQRGNSLWFLFLLFLVVVIVVGKKTGCRALFGLGISVALIIGVLLPQLFSGRSPILISICIAIAILSLVLYTSHGFKRKTHIAVFGTASALIITGILSWLFIYMSKLTGVYSEDAYFAVTALVGIDPRGLLFAGLLIGALGVLDDVAVSQASIVEELHFTNPNLSRFELAKRALRVGQDHIGSVVNTLILAYVGSSLPLFILFFGKGDVNLPLSLVFNNELITTEIIRMLVGSIGLILAMPITTAIAAVYIKRK